jgi:peptide/nickel transport system permease protein
MRFFLSRLLYTAAILVAVSLMVFAVTELLPGNVVTMILGTDATAEETKRLTAQLGLDRPAIERYGSWVAGALRGDFGMSLRMQRPITPILLERLGNSLVLAGIAFVLVAVGGLLLGLVTSWKEGSRLDRTLNALAAIGSSLPEFVTGTVLVLLVGGGLFSLFPSSGYNGLRAGFGDVFTHLFLPALTLAVILVAYVGRVTRTSMIDALRSDYVRAARLKGLSESSVLFRHVMPNALVPAVTVLFMNVGWLVGGIVVVEAVFVFPGIGRLMLFAISERDWPLIQACALITAAVYVVSNFIGDLAVLAMSPKIRHATR